MPPGCALARLERCGILDLTMATQPSHPSSSGAPRLVELTVRSAQGDLLEVEPLDLGPDAPATAALAAERGPHPADTRQRGE